MKFPFRVIAGYAIGALVVLIVILLNRSSSIQAPPVPSGSVSPSPVAGAPTEAPDVRQRLVSDAALNTVAVQTFQSSKLMRQGSGIVLSADGLVATTYDVAPVPRLSSASAPYVYQILSGDKILRAVPVAWDYLRNLTLMRVSAGDLSVADLNAAVSYESGKELTLTGKLVDFSKPVTFSQRASIMYATDKTIVLDTVPNNLVSGAKAVDGQGRFFGLVYTRSGKTYLIGTAAVRGFLESYLGTVRK